MSREARKRFNNFAAGDQDKERRTHAEVLINAYNRELERTRLAASSQGIFVTSDGMYCGPGSCSNLLKPLFFDVDQDVDGAQDDENDSDDDSFHYPGTPTSPVIPVTARPASIRSYHTDYFSLTRSSSSRPVDLTPSLSRATEFRVPTQDAPATTPRGNAPVPHAMHSQWERDSNATECRSCHKRFTFYFRKVSVLSLDVTKILI